MQAKRARVDPVGLSAKDLAAFLASPLHLLPNLIRSGKGAVAGADEQNAAVGERDGNRGLPGEFGQEFAGDGGLGGADEEGEASGGSEEPGGEGQGIGEALDGAEADEIGGHRRGGTGGGALSPGGGRGEQGLGASVEYIDIGQCEGADDFSEEGGFFGLRLDEGETHLRGVDGEREAGESGAGAEVESVAGGGSLVAGCWLGRKTEIPRLRVRALRFFTLRSG